MRMLGPALGYALASMCLKIYISPSLTPTINNLDPRWLGAWWLGWFIFASLMFVFAFFMGKVFICTILGFSTATKRKITFFNPCRIGKKGKFYYHDKCWMLFFFIFVAQIYSFVSENIATGGCTTCHSTGEKSTWCHACAVGSHESISSRYAKWCIRTSFVRIAEHFSASPPPRKRASMTCLKFNWMSSHVWHSIRIICDEYPAFRLKTFCWFSFLLCSSTAGCIGADMFLPKICSKHSGAWCKTKRSC